MKAFFSAAGIALFLVAGAPPALATGAPPALATAPSAGPPPGTPNMAGLISQDDYPVEALRRGEQGTVGVRLDIDSAGRVSACTVTQSSASASLDEGTCALLQKRARFIPARDANGRPTTDSVTTKISWRLMQSEDSGPVQPALEVWLACLHSGIRALVATPATREDIADKAFAGCTSQEAAVVAASNPGMAPPSRDFLERTRGGTRTFLLQLIDDERRRTRR